MTDIMDDISAELKGVNPFVDNTEQTMTQKSARIDVTTVSVTPGYGTGKPFEVRYMDAKVIGNGSFGVVYMATLYDTKEKVAIKKVKQDARYKNRELQIMKKLEHPNIVKLKYYHYTTDSSGDTYLNLILEFMPKTLFQVNKAASPISDFLIKLYMFQLFRGLSFLHMYNVCHRDIKPQNLLIDPEYGVLKICDFGSAKVLGNNENSVAYICSRYYRAPELVYNCTQYTTKIDTWSAGTVMAEMYLHQPMFRGETASTQINAIIKVLGSPTKEEMKAMNPLMNVKEFPRTKPIHSSKIFAQRVSSSAIDLIYKLLKYDPRCRMSAIEAMAEPFFDALRKNPQTLPNGNLMPRIFDWFEKEYNIRPDLNRKIQPTLTESDEEEQFKQVPPTPPIL